MMQSALWPAPAKINLTLHVTGQRADGYHLLDSLVVFTEFGDQVQVAASGDAPLSITGRFAQNLASEPDNLVLRAARLLGAGDAAITLTKNLPVASGMGGGSSDAAAVLRALVAMGHPAPERAALLSLGADLPVCYAAPTPQRMQGLGEILSPVDHVPALWLVLVNPGVGLPTPAVFRGLTHRTNPAMPESLPAWTSAAAFCEWLGGMRNDLEAPAKAALPQVGAVLDQIRVQPGCRLARMTGSGATCFGLFTDERAARAAEAALARPDWFCVATKSYGSVS